MARSHFLALFLLGSAQATQLNFGTSTQTLPSSLTLEVGISEFPIAGGQSNLFLSNQTMRLGYSRSLALPLGTLSSQTELSHPWSGGLRLSSQTSGSLGPVALSLKGEAFNVALSQSQPFKLWDEEAPDLRSSGWNFSLSTRYRLSRQLIASAGAELGLQTNGFIEIESRRPLSQPTTEGTETDTTLTLRGGARAGAGVLGLTTGLTYTREDGLTLRADALLGPQPGVTGHLNLPPLGETEIMLYGAYESWRKNSAPLRYGAELSRPLGTGTVSLDLRGGQPSSGEQGGGLQLRYSFPLEH